MHALLSHKIEIWYQVSTTGFAMYTLQNLYDIFTGVIYHTIFKVSDGCINILFSYMYDNFPEDVG
jgi:hypothetical protein